MSSQLKEKLSSHLALELNAKNIMYQRNALEYFRISSDPRMNRRWENNRAPTFSFSGDKERCSDYGAILKCNGSQGSSILESISPYCGGALSGSEIISNVRTKSVYTRWAQGT
jgi:hypothetical protein